METSAYFRPLLSKLQRDFSNLILCIYRDIVFWSSKMVRKSNTKVVNYQNEMVY